MCSMPSTTCPRLCTIWTAVAPDAVTRRTNEPTPGGYRPHPAGLLVTTRDTDPTTNPLVRTISQHPTPPDPQQRYNSGLIAARGGIPLAFVAAAALTTAGAALLVPAIKQKPQATRVT